ncbi:hypothetical protein LY76DRAFT_603901 [Colletotrichum caudatum]|nr:hypothetical protein LY76DRAFT_603901 [Colletotrichum caudatum]
MDGWVLGKSGVLRCLHVLHCMLEGGRPAAACQQEPACALPARDQTEEDKRRRWWRGVMEPFVDDGVGIGRRRRFGPWHPWLEAACQKDYPYPTREHVLVARQKETVAGSTTTIPSTPYSQPPVPPPVVDDELKPDPAYQVFMQWCKDTRYRRSGGYRASNKVVGGKPSTVSAPPGGSHSGNLTMRAGGRVGDMEQWWNSTGDIIFAAAPKARVPSTDGSIACLLITIGPRRRTTVVYRNTTENKPEQNRIEQEEIERRRRGRERYRDTLPRWYPPFNPFLPKNILLLDGVR